jgi:hypothetical protein
VFVLSFLLPASAGWEDGLAKKMRPLYLEEQARLEYTCDRFSDRDLHVTHAGKEDFTFVRSEVERPNQPKKQLYRI